MWFPSAFSFSSSQTAAQVRNDAVIDGGDFHAATLRSSSRPCDTRVARTCLLRCGICRAADDATCKGRPSAHIAWVAVKEHELSYHHRKILLVPVFTHIMVSRIKFLCSSPVARDRSPSSVQRSIRNKGSQPSPHPSWYARGLW